MKHILITSVTIVITALFASCSGSDNAQADGSASLTEEQRNEAANKGATAARAIINATDSLEIQAKLLDARAKQSEYVTQKRAAEAEVFDTAFIHTLRAVRPDIAKEIESQD
ncbi:MAG: hypothetical protein NC402_01850 [Prevotella sp.]|nr:hypothetical protein [Prevotella sp.]MCM1074266.1 hypothetical protein [Ruminococcus sp.]